MAHLHEISTPAVCIDAETLESNLAAMAAVLPGARLRPHVKAHKCTALAARQLAHGHRGFTCATVREVIGMAAAGLGEDLLLANEVVDPVRLRALAELDARVTVAVDSVETVEAAAAAGLGEVLIDVNVGLPRCGCVPEDAGRVADLARRRGLGVRGVMGYEGHLMLVEAAGERARGCEQSMEALLAAHRLTGGDVISAGGTGTYECNRWATEIQAGSYALMDSAYAKLELPFVPAIWILATVISVSASGYAVADCGLKSLGMDHGDSDVEAATVLFFSDEHVTFVPEGAVSDGAVPDGAGPGDAGPGDAGPATAGASGAVKVGDRVRIFPAHIDPTLAYHDRAYLVSGAEIVDTWAIDLRGW